MKINVIGMILNNAGRRSFDGAVLDDDGKPMSAADSLHTLMKAYARAALAQAPAAEPLTDQARMQWIAINFPQVKLWFLEGQSRWGIESIPGAWDTLRQAIDAALAAAKEQS